MLREDFLNGMRLAATSVSVVTTKTPEGRLGVTVSALCSLSADPPSLLVCVHHMNRAVEAIRASGSFCANILAEDQTELSEVFAGRREAPNGDRFAMGRWLPLASGAPALEGAIASFDCTLVKEVRWGSHHVLIGSVCDIELGDGRPLVYCDRSYGRVALDSLLAAT